MMRVFELEALGDGVDANGSNLRKENLRIAWVGCADAEHLEAAPDNLVVGAVWEGVNVDEHERCRRDERRGGDVEIWASCQSCSEFQGTKAWLYVS